MNYELYRSTEKHLDLVPKGKPLDPITYSYGWSGCVFAAEICELDCGNSNEQDLNLWAGENESLDEDDANNNEESNLGPDLDVEEKEEEIYVDFSEIHDNEFVFHQNACSQNFQETEQGARCPSACGPSGDAQFPKYFNARVGPFPHARRQTRECSELTQSTHTSEERKAYHSISLPITRYLYTFSEPLKSFVGAFRELWRNAPKSIWIIDMGCVIAPGKPDQILEISMKNASGECIIPTTLVTTTLVDHSTSLRDLHQEPHGLGSDMAGVHTDHSTQKLRENKRGYQINDWFGIASVL